MARDPTPPPAKTRRRRFRRGSNLPYVTARVKARKAALLPPDAYQRMLLLELPDISRLLGESLYRREIEELGARHRGVDLIEQATYTHLARTYRSILGYCKGDLREKVALYLQRWDVWNLKTLLRGKFSGATPEEIREDLVAAGGLTPAHLEELLSHETIPALVESLPEGPYREALQRALRETGQEAQVTTLVPLETALDRAHYQRLSSELTARGRAETLFLTFVRTEVDVENLKNLLRLRREGLEPERVMDYMLPGGQEFAEAALRRLSEKTVADILQEVRRSPLWEELRPAAENYREGASLSPLLHALDLHLLHRSHAFSHLYPLSILPILDFLLRQKREIDNIRAIARAKEHGLGEDLVKEQLLVLS